MREESKLEHQIRELKVHDHVCLLYRDFREQMRSAIPFLEVGLSRGEQCVYIADENSAGQIVGELKLRGVKVSSTLRDDRLSIIYKQDSYLREGHFDPDTMIEFLRSSTEAAKAAGFSALRATGEMTWTLGGDPGTERLIEYEAKLNSFLPRQDMSAVCQYNMNRFSPATLLDVIRVHPIVIIGDVISDNPGFISPSEQLKPQPERQLERMISALVNRGAAQEKLEHLAFYDPLTDLPNRRLFLEFVQKFLAAAARTKQLAALLYLDLDGFKQINDNLGHKAGDVLLKETARRLNKCLRASDAVGRLGGDEFSVLITNVGCVDEVKRVNKKILSELAKPYVLENQKVHSSACIGISLYPIDGKEADVLLKKADAALLAAKSSGKNRCMIYRDIAKDAA